MDETTIWILRICGCVCAICGFGSLMQLQTRLLGIGMSLTGIGLALASFGAGLGWLMLGLGMVVLIVGISKGKQLAPPKE